MSQLFGNFSEGYISGVSAQEDTNLRESERYRTACRYVLSTDYVSKETLIAILGIEEKTSENK